MGDHGCRWLVIPGETVFVELVGPTRHEQGCGVCSQDSQVELCVCYHIRLEIQIMLVLISTSLRGRV
jgi:hypothetical protein